jgi:hypothetical protein
LAYGGGTGRRVAGPQWHLHFHAARRQAQATEGLRVAGRETGLLRVPDPAGVEQKRYKAIQVEEKEEIAELGPRERPRITLLRLTHPAFQQTGPAASRPHPQYLLPARHRRHHLHHLRGLLADIQSEDVEEEKASFRSRKSYHLRGEGQKNKDL